MVKFGDVLEMTSFTIVTGELGAKKTPSARLTYKVPKDHRGIFLYMGNRKTGTPFDGTQALKRIGFVCPSSDISWPHMKSLWEYAQDKPELKALVDNVFTTLDLVSPPEVEKAEAERKA